MDQTKYINYVIQKHATKYKTFCEKNQIHYSHEVLRTFLLCIQKKPHLFIKYLQNTFLEKIRPFLIDMYCETVSLQWSMRRFLIRYRKKRMISCNQYDLSLSEFTDPIELIIQNKKYTFQRNELYQLIYSALLHSDIYMISSPLPVKNPYTGIPFTKNMLYLICGSIQMNPLFYYFQKCHFDCNKFLLIYEGLLRTHLIEKTIKEFTPVQIKQRIEIMLLEVTLFDFSTENYEAILKIENIPINRMKPLLFHYYYSIYSLNPYQRSIEYKQLVNELINLRKNTII